jgi:DNA-binding FadR family transcriptional regulator
MEVPPVSTAPIAADSLPKLVMERLIDMIASGELGHGARLPTERQLCETLGVSRIALREATQVLKMLGVLDSSPGRGTIVSASAPYAAIQLMSLLVGTSRDALLHLIEARRVIEAAAARLAAQRADDAELDTMEACLERQHAALGDPVRFSEEDMVLHRTMVAAGHNPVLLQMLDAVARSLWSARLQTGTIPGRLEKAYGFHSRLLAALRQHRPALAERVLLEHLDDLAADIVATRQLGGIGR